MVQSGKCWNLFVIFVEIIGTHHQSEQAVLECYGNIIVQAFWLMYKDLLEC